MGKRNKATNNLFTSITKNYTFTEGHTATDIAKVVITSYTFCNAADNCELYFDMDNLVYYETVSAEKAAIGATEKEKFASCTDYLEESYVANGGSLKHLTNNLKFTADNLPEDTTLSWETDTDVITVDGKIKRDLSNVTTTQITGTLTNGDVTVTKTHTVNIAPLTTTGVSEVLDFEKFSVGAPVGGTNNWTKSSTYMDAVIAAESNGNHFSKLVSTQTSNSTASNALTYNFQNVPSGTDSRYYVMKAKVHMPEDCKDSINIAFNLNGIKSGEWMLGSAGYNGYIYGSALITSGSIWHKRATGVTLGQTVPTKSYVDLEILIDKELRTVYYYQNGTHTETAKYDSTVDGAKTTSPSLDNVTKATLAVHWRSNTGEVWLDDVYFYTKATENNALASLSDKDKVGFIAEYLNSNVFDGQSKGNITSNLDLTAGLDYDAIDVDVVWKSSSPTTVSDAGEILKRGDLPETVVMTATVTANEAIAEETVKFNVAPANTTIVDKSIFSADFDGVYTAANFTPTAAFFSLVDNNSYGKSARLYDSTKAVSFATKSNTYAGSYKGRIMSGVDLKYDLSEWIADNPNKEAAIRYFISGNGATFTVDLGVAGNYYVKVGDDMIWMADEQGKELLKENVWHHLDVDYNFMGNSIDVYLDGVLLTEIPAKPVGQQLGSSPFRRVTISSTAPCELLIDNMYAVQYTTDSDIVKVDAALKEAKRTLAVKTLGYPSDYRLIQTTPNLRDVAVGSMELPSEGSNDGQLGLNDYIPGTNDRKPGSGAERFVGGAAMTWTANGSSVSGTYEVPVSPKEVTFTVTATSGSVTDSATFTNKMAPVYIDSVSSTKVTLKGNYSGKKLVIARTINGTIDKIKMFDIDSSVNDNDEITFESLNSEGATLHYYVIDIANDKLIPVSYSK